MSFDPYEYARNQINIESQKHEEKIVETINKAADWYKFGLYINIHRCESPIEKLIALAFVTEQLGNPDLQIFVEKQVKIDRYRVDFILHVLDRGKWPNERLASVIIECDGHDFHEKTKEQAARDKSRDRFLQSQGYTVLRFTGSEIWKDAEACARESIDIAYKKAYGHGFYNELEDDE